MAHTGEAEAEAGASQVGGQSGLPNKTWSRGNRREEEEVDYCHKYLGSKEPHYNLCII